MVSNFLDSLLDLMPLSITVKSRGTADRYGKRTAGATRLVRARLEGTTRIVRNMQGVETSLTGVLYCADILIQKTDLIVMPNGDEPQIVSVDTEYDETGPVYQRVMLG